MPRKKQDKPSIEAPPDHVVMHRGLPVAPDVESYVLGFLLRGDQTALPNLSTDSFSLEKNRRIFERIVEMHNNGIHVDRVTLAGELQRTGQLQSVDGLSYLVSLDAGIPDNADFSAYVKILNEKSLLRRLILTAQNIATRGITEDGGAAELIQDATSQFLTLRPEDGSQQGRTPTQIIEDFPGGASAFLDPSQRRRGLPTGLAKLDEMTDGMHGGELIVVGARPAVGKTAFATGIAMHLALTESIRKPVAMFSLEMSGASLMTRMVCRRARVDQHRFRLGYLKQEERRALQRALFDLTESPLKIFDSFHTRISQITAAIREQVDQEGIKLAIVDYLGLIAADNNDRRENRNQDVSNMTRLLKLTAHDLDIPIMVLSQLSRMSERRPGATGRPQLQDLRDSGSIEQDADTVLLLHREELYKRDREDLKGLAEIIVAKQRNGPAGTANVRFLPSFTSFENRADDLFDQDAPQD